MTISNELLSSTLYSIRDGEVDELFRKVAFLDNAKKKGGVEYEDGGIKIQRPLALTEHSNITELPTGYEAVSLSVQGVMQPAVYDWIDFVAPIVISKKEETENMGEKAIVKIVEARMRSVMGLLRREANKQILVGTSSVLGNLNTLNGFNNGFLEAETAGGGNQNNSVGGISKATYSATTGWQNQAADVQGAFGTNGIRVMQQAAIQASSVAPMGDVSCYILSEACMANYRRALFAQERYVDEKTLDAGRMVLAFGGAVVEQDTYMGVAGTSTDFGAGFMSGYGINFDAIKLIMHKDCDFAVSPFEHVPGTTTRAAQVYVKMQLIADHLGSNIVIFDGETY
jgi:hypothetical protein